MGDLKSRLNNARAKLLRRASGTSSSKSIASSIKSDGRKGQPRRSASLTKLPEVSTQHLSSFEDERDQRLSKSEVLPKSTRDPQPQRTFETTEDDRSECLIPQDRRSQDNNSTSNNSPRDIPIAHPAVTLEEPTPVPPPVQPQNLEHLPLPADDGSQEEEPISPLPTRTQPATSHPQPPGPVRRQSLVTGSNARVIKTLLDPDPTPATSAPTTDYFSTDPPTFNPGMLQRKIWVKRPNASPTLVQIREDDLVDDVRDTILKKYANSLGRTFDSPDVVLRICPRDSNQKSADRILGPEEEMCRTLDAYYPGGQTVNDALLIEVPHKRTPKPSPRLMQQGIPYYYDEQRPDANATEYFPPMPIVPSPGALTTASHDTRASHAAHERSIAVLQTGQLPPLPSPGSSRRAHHSIRPKYPRHNTASPTTLNPGIPTTLPTRPSSNRPRQDSSASESKHAAPVAPHVPTPPAAEPPSIRQSSTPPTPRVSSPRPKNRKKQKSGETPTLLAGLLDGSVPPINVLIVEDNIINLRVLGAFMERLKVRWQRAMNGKEAVDKWRAGGFHLVLMDIQLPIMNGLEATKEIRRLERVNSIGVFSSASNEAPTLDQVADGAEDKELKEGDRLKEMGLFKSPVIIVALTASSLQSDRHEALAAGCNDFLTKPVNFVWLERKVKEWGCMQALIDFDGWRKWKDFAAQSETTKSTSKLSASFSGTAPRRQSNNAVVSASTSNAVNGVNGGSSTSRTKDEKDKRKRQSIGVGSPVPEEKETESPAPDHS